MFKYGLYMLMVLVASVALPLRAAESPLESTITTTAPSGEIFGPLFPSSADRPFHGTSDHDPVPNLFDPLLATMLRHDTTGRPGQTVGFEAEVASRLIQSAPPATGPVVTASPDGSMLDPQIAAAPPPLQQPPPAAEGYGTIPMLLIGSGVLILVILGIIQLRSSLREKQS
jgi:hypothetical protein